MPDLNYVPYSITGDSYQLELLQASANYVIAAVNPYAEYYGADTDPTKPGNATYMGVASSRLQERAIAWGLREVAEAAYATPGDDPLKNYYTSELNRAMDGLVKVYITDNSMAAYGDLKGFLLGGEGAGGAPLVAPWQEVIHCDRPGRNRRDEPAAGL